MNREDWNRLARAYDAEVLDIFMRDARCIIGPWLRRHGLLTGRRTVVDAGCGTGSLFKRFGRRFGVKYGIDHSTVMLQIAARRCRSVPGCEWRQGDVRLMPRALRGTADLVVCSNVITYRSIAECRRVVRQVVRCLRSRGRLLLIVPSLESHDAGVTYRLGRRPVRRRGTSAIVRRTDRFQRFFTEDGARRLVQSAGLSDIRVHAVWYPWIDEGVTDAPADAGLPNVWMVEARIL